MKVQRSDDWHRKFKLTSAWVAAIGALFAGTGAFLSGVGDIIPWLDVISQWFNTIPRWQIWAGGALVCVLILIARFTLFRRREPCERKRSRGGTLTSRRQPNG
ncbi:MAG: hypothetical protein ABIU96_03875 [Rhodanobacter sp.]